MTATQTPRTPTVVSEPSRHAPISRSFAQVLVALAGVSGYLLLYQASKPSPVSEASTAELLVTVAYAAVVAVLGAALGALLARLVAALLPARLRARDVGTLVVTTTVLSAGALLFIDNALYTVSSDSLRTESGALPVKLAFGVFSLSLGLFLARALRGTGRRHPRAWVVAGSVTLVVGLAVAAWSHQQTVRPAPLTEAGPALAENVVILSADGIDADHLSAYGYARDTTPFLRRHAEEFLLFENAFANNGNTTGSIASLLTGRTPLETGVVYPPDILHTDDALRSLPHLLGAEGYYRSNWAVPHYADAHDQNMVRAFDVDNGDRAQAWFGRLPLGAGPARWFVTEEVVGTGRLVLDLLGVAELDNPYAAVNTVVGDVLGDDGRMAAVLDEVSTRDRFFVNTHFMVTHGPTYAVESPRYSRGQVQDEAWMTDFYDDAIREFDGDVATVYDRLEATGKLDDTVLVVTSDHGQQYDATRRVPLMIRFPGATPSGRVAVNVQRLDLAPTLLAALGYEQPSWMTGADLLDPQAPPADRVFVAANTAERAFGHNLGFRPAGKPVTLTAIRCRSYVQRGPDGVVSRGAVPGSTADCDAVPEESSVRLD